MTALVLALLATSAADAGWPAPRDARVRPSRASDGGTLPAAALPAPPAAPPGPTAPPAAASPAEPSPAAPSTSTAEADPSAAAEPEPLPGSETLGTRLLADELSVGLGVGGFGFLHAHGRSGDLFVSRIAEGRLLLVRGLTLDAALAVTAATTPGPAPSTTLTARAGWTGESFSVVAGAVLQQAGAAQPALQILPTLRAQVSLGTWGLSAGLFDHHGLTLGHVAVDLGDISLGYVAPIGLVLSGRVRLFEYLSIRATGFAFRIANAEAAMLTVAVAVGPEAGPRD